MRIKATLWHHCCHHIITTAVGWNDDIIMYYYYGEFDKFFGEFGMTLALAFSECFTFLFSHSHVQTISHLSSSSQLSTHTYRATNSHTHDFIIFQTLGMEWSSPLSWNISQTKAFVCCSSCLRASLAFSLFRPREEMRTSLLPYNMLLWVKCLVCVVVLLIAVWVCYYILYKKKICTVECFAFMPFHFIFFSLILLILWKLVWFWFG